jgi:hypothetical protein
MSFSPARTDLALKLLTDLYSSSVKVNIMFVHFVVDCLFMLLLFDAYTEHNANFAPALLGGKFLSTEKEVRFGNKSESDLFLENQKILIHFCMKQHEDMSRFFF